MTVPEYHSQEEFLNRLKKLEELKNQNINPYPYRFELTHTLDKLIKEYKDQTLGDSEKAEKGLTPKAKVAGRLKLFRAMGKNGFAQIQDENGKLQIMFNRDHTVIEGYEPKEGLSNIKFIEKKLDLGDIIGVDGNLFFTHSGELTLYAKKITLLSKALLPLPDKHSGLNDKGVRFRKRWLDLISNEEAKNTLLLRSRILKEIRHFMEKEGFIEVETPILQNIYGGAEAKPFETELNTLHQKMFLRISLEIPLKKLLVGGLSKIYEIGKVFRNEGIDRTHNPEFTELEAYAAFWDYNDMMSFMENLFETIALRLFNDTKLDINGQIIDLKAPWKRMTMKEAISTYANLNVDQLSTEEMKEKLQGKITPKELSQMTRGSLIAALFQEFAESSLIQPHHITDHPIETTPLCKPLRKNQSSSETLVERFESFILGTESCNAYSELNDPVLQRELLVKQAEQKLLGKEDAAPLDEEFIEAICQGMPPAGGIGIGIDRLVMLFTRSQTIKDVLYFPLMKPEE